MPFAAALSEHPVAAHAVGEVVGQTLDVIGPNPDLAVLFVSADHTGALEDVTHAIATLLAPRTLLGATAGAVLAGPTGAEDTPGIALFAARLPDTVTPVRLTAEQTPDGWLLAGLGGVETHPGASLVVLADPFTFPVGAFLADTAVARPGLPVIGGLASAARGPGGNRLVLDDGIVTHGAVGVVLGPAASPTLVVSQGCRPIGQPFIVTKAERTMLFELGGRPALERLMEMIEALSSEERALAARGLHCGLVVDERKAEFERGDFLIRAVMGADRETGAVAVGDEVPVGSTVQFQVRDAATAGEDLVSLLSGHRADGALVFTCNGRGAGMFGTPHHDAELVQEVLGPLPAAGMFCAGELGPVGGHNALHGFTASVAMFTDPD
jgi:small ligand-binding sensory domain FIST